LVVDPGLVVGPGADHYFEKYNALSPFRQSFHKLLAPINLTKSLIYSLDKAEDYLSKLSCNNLVKIFLLNMLNTEFKTTAKLGSDGANILNTVKLKNPYIIEKVIEYSSESIECFSTNVRFSEINFSSYKSNIFKLNRIYKRLQGRFVKDNLVFREPKKTTQTNPFWGDSDGN